MLAIFKILLSVCSILIIGVYFLIYKRNKNYFKNLFFKRIGVICSKCPNMIITDDSELQDCILDRQENADVYFNECLACRRESRLNLLINFFSLRDRFDRWILTKKSETVLLLFMSIPFTFIIASLFIENKTFYSIASIFNSTSLILYWLIMIYRIYLCREPLK